MPQELGVLPSVDINLHTAAVYESEGGREVDNKALSTEHVITHQHICLHAFNPSTRYSSHLLDV